MNDVFRILNNKVYLPMSQNDLGDEVGEPLIPDRQIRIIDNPQHKYEGKNL